MSKVVAPRDTKPDSGKELTESNLLTEIWRKKSADCTVSNPTGAEYARIGNLGRRFLTCGIFTLDDPEKSTVGKCLTCPFYAAEGETSTGSASTRNSPLNKRGHKYFLQTDK